MTTTTNNSNNSGGASASSSSAEGTSAAGENSGGGGGHVGTNNHASSNNSNNPANANSSNNGNNTKPNAIEAEFNQIPDLRAWQMVYQEMRERCEREAAEENFSTGEAEKSQNRCLNRYRDVSPYDHSRIILQRRSGGGGGGGGVDYINANLVKLERADRQYILTQGPLGNTVGHFWLMVWEQRSKAILMLNKLMEKKQIKCHKYWPDGRGPANALKLDDVRLSVEFMRCEEYKNYNRRWFKLTDLETQQSREIHQFHYTTWPDFGIPSSPVAFLQFLQHVRESGVLEPEMGPAVVHCSAGIGRSGTFCLVDCCLVLIEKEGVDGVSVRDVLYELRRSRMGLIQTSDQLYFSYQAIIEGIKLLKDPTFLESSRESPIINCNDDNGSSNNDEQQQLIDFAMDETPPPLPPRTHSLLLPPPTTTTTTSSASSSSSATLSAIEAAAAAAAAAGGGGKPLPKIPASASCNDELYAHDNSKHNHSKRNSQQKDALNNFINSEKQQNQHAATDVEHTMSNRPLPPLPTTTTTKQQHMNSLDRLHESDSDENEFYEDDDDDDDGDDGDDDANTVAANDDVIALLKQSGDGTLNSSAKMLNAGNIETNGNTEEQNNMNERNREKLPANGIDALNSAELPNELKRRKRNERQTAIEQKVNEIKRKQRESEANQHAAKKRRRSLFTYLAAGVLVGVVCVYAYAKFT